MYNMCRINSLLVSDVSLPWFTKGLYDWSLRQTIKKKLQNHDWMSQDFEARK